MVGKYQYVEDRYLLVHNSPLQDSCAGCEVAAQPRAARAADRLIIGRMHLTDSIARMPRCFRRTPT